MNAGNGARRVRSGCAPLPGGASSREPDTTVFALPERRQNPDALWFYCDARDENVGTGAKATTFDSVAKPPNGPVKQKSRNYPNEK